jgi:hypothetical protein
MKPIDTSARNAINEAIRAQAREGQLSCAEAFRIAGELDATPLDLGRIADELDVRLVRCQLGLFGYGPSKSVVEPADKVSPELERALCDGLILGQLPCSVAWAIASRFGIPKLHVSGAAEKFELRIGQCQLGAF